MLARAVGWPRPRSTSSISIALSAHGCSASTSMIRVAGAAALEPATASDACT